MRIIRNVLSCVAPQVVAHLWYTPVLSVHRACGATICNRTDELKESDVGTKCGLFEIRKHGDEYFTYLVECREPKACSIVLRGASKDILKEACCTISFISFTYPYIVYRFNIGLFKTVL